MSDVKIYELLDKLKRISNLRSWKNTCPAEYQMIVDATPFLPAKCTIRQRIWHLDNGKLEPVLCAQCGINPRPWNDSKHEYRMFCSNECVHAHGGLHAKRRSTNLERYGVENIREDADFMAQKRLDKTGYKFPLQDPKVVEAIKQTNLDKYGVEWNIASESSTTKKQATVNDRYSSHHHMLCFNVWKRVIDRDGRSDDELLKVWLNLNSAEFLTREHHTLGKTLTLISEELGVSSTIVGLHCRRLGVDVRQQSTSMAELQLRQYLESLGLVVIPNTRSVINPQELDLYVPTRNLAIEYNGLFFHGELSGKIPNYHLNKTNECKKKGIQLIHIRDDEWFYKPDIVKSRIASKLGIYTRKIYGRNTTIGIVDNLTLELFLEQNHIQGWCSSSVNLGLYCGNELVSVMTFGKSRFNSNYQYELLRFCTLLHVTVVGGASKLFNFFTRKYTPNSVISYCNLSWNTGNVYESIGFEYINDSPPAPVYFKRNSSVRTINRIQLQKHKLINILPDYDPNKTSWENLINNGYDRYWDCGNSVWGWKGKGKC